MPASQTPVAEDSRVFRLPAGGASVMRAEIGIICLLSASAFAQQQPITKVHTALNHLTVIELPEPITMAAAGSDAFEITRHGNRVFIEPVRANVDTDLFLWTEHGKSVYELEPAGEVNAMNVLIAPRPQPQPSAAADLRDSEIQKIADMAMTKALLQTQHISQRDTKPMHDGVSIQVEDVIHAKDSLYVRYSVVNDGKTPYRVLDPTVQAIRPAGSPISVLTLTNTQLSDKAVSKMGSGQTSNVPVVRSEIEQKDVAPGTAATGVVAIRIESASPQVYRFVFGNDGDRLVVATVVL
jgi:hypothetical protein